MSSPLWVKVLLHITDICCRKTEVLCDFDTGTLKGMTAVAAADEGINVPEVNIVVFLSTTSLRHKIQQRLGRGLRATEGKQKTCSA